jgi:hypothetical protein
MGWVVDNKGMFAHPGRCLTTCRAVIPMVDPGWLDQKNFGILQLGAFGFDFRYRKGGFQRTRAPGQEAFLGTGMAWELLLGNYGS